MSYVPFDVRLIAAELGCPLSAMAHDLARDEARAAAGLGRVELRLARFLFRHVYVMGSSHHFYVLPPQQMIVTVGGG